MRERLLESFRWRMKPVRSWQVGNSEGCLVWGRDGSCALTRLGQEAEHQISGRFDFKESEGLRKSLKWIEQGGPTV